MTDEQQSLKPWYKQPWLWFILAPLIAVFIYGFTFLYLSIVTMDGVVKDDFYRKVRSYEVDSLPNQTAIARQIRATVRLDSTTGDIMVQLFGEFPSMPKQLSLDIVHPTHQKYDQHISLRPLGEQRLYSGSLQGHLSGKRYLYISAADDQWSLRTEVFPPYEQRTFELAPSQ